MRDGTSEWCMLHACGGDRRDLQIHERSVLAGDGVGSFDKRAMACGRDEQLFGRVVDAACMRW